MKKQTKITLREVQFYKKTALSEVQFVIVEAELHPSKTFRREKPLSVVLLGLRVFLEALEKLLGMGFGGHEPHLVAFLENG